MSCVVLCWSAEACVVFSLMMCCAVVECRSVCSVLCRAIFLHIKGWASEGGVRGQNEAANNNKIVYNGLTSAQHGYSASRSWGRGEHMEGWGVASQHAVP